MSEFIISNLQDSSILSLNDMKESVQIDPTYQREGGVWSEDKKQLFIDSLLNKYDVPKFYFHQLTGIYKHPSYLYSIIDGRQRLETIWDFIDGKFALADTFVFLEDPSIKLAGLTYLELAREFPRQATRLNGRTLTVIVVATEDMDFIEDMFTRLNEAVPLNAAEKRNSFRGPLPGITRDLVQRPFFTDCVRVSQTRYQHHDVVAKILYLQFGLIHNNKVGDTKKATLDDFYRTFPKLFNAANEASVLLNMVTTILEKMEATFTSKDQLLRSTGVLPVYFVLFSQAVSIGQADKITRKRLVDFEAMRAENREKFAGGEDNVNREWLEYDELSRSSNDAAAIAARVMTIQTYLDNCELIG
jgi:hypothetical protein